MTDFSAIYGFEFTRAFSANGLCFQPIESQLSAARASARNLTAHNITGIVSGPSLTRSTRFHLEGVLSFIEHLDVAISEPTDHADAIINPNQYFEPVLYMRPRFNGGGAVLGSDSFRPYRDSRQAFIELTLRYLADTELCEKTRFNSLLFKCVETFRQRQPFLEISYFLLISALEAFSRAHQNDYDSQNAAEPISRTLLHYGFDVYQDNPSHLPRSISTYLHIRNALFHRGDFVANIRMNDDRVNLKCADYLFNLSMLVSLLVMKIVGFDDGHTNWDCWFDRQMHK